jgi:IS30 family transposase
VSDRRRLNTWSLGRRSPVRIEEQLIAALVERHSRYVTLAKAANKDTQTVVSALIKQAKTLPNELYKSLTWDRSKLADHRRFTLATNIEVYFCDPQSPWQRGSNENTNGLLRQYFPEGTDLSVYSQTHLNKMARQLNERPRKTLRFRNPRRGILRLCSIDRLSRHLTTYTSRATHYARREMAAMSDRPEADPETNRRSSEHAN